MTDSERIDIINQMSKDAYDTAKINEMTVEEKAGFWFAVAGAVWLVSSMPSTETVYSIKTDEK